MDVTVPGSVHYGDRRMHECGSMGCLCHLHPILRLVENAYSPVQPLNYSLECIGGGYGPCVDQSGIDDIVTKHLDNLRKALAYKDSDQDDGVQDGGGAVR